VNDTALKHAPKGAAVCSFALAFSRYFDIATWSRRAEVCGEETARLSG
jgi:hypothetical protein